MITTRFIRTTALFTLLAGGNAMGVGFRLPNQDPEGISRGNAFAATADNPSAIYYNPAGITQLEGSHLSVGVYAISTNIDFKSALGGDASTIQDLQYVPQIYYVHSPEESPLSYGFGVYAPYGLGIDYDGDTPFDTLAQEGNLLYATFNPVVAYRLNSQLSVAVGITANYSKVDLTRSIFGPGSEFSFKGNGWDVGYNFGLLWQPVKEWSFGLNYRSSTRINFEGESIADPLADWQDTEAELDFPYFIVGGVSYRPNDDWNFEFNLDWTDWDSVNDAKFKGTFGGDQIFPFRYRSSFMYEFGVTRQLGSGYYISGGYIYSENSVPGETLSPLNPDSNLHLGSIGFGHRGDVFSWAVGYHFAYNGGRTVRNNTPSLIGETANGEWKTFNHAVNVSVRYQF
jgi:long-chain fatty acid transport protein